MRGPWFPRLRTGECSDEMIDGRGTEGRYWQFDWLGASLTISLHSTYAEDRWWRKHREMERAWEQCSICRRASPDVSGDPPRCDSHRLWTRPPRNREPRHPRGSLGG